MRKLFIFIFLIFSIISFGQHKAKQDIIKLKNGSVIRGKILENNKNTKIQTSEGNIFVYPNSEILEVTKGFNPILIKQKGFLNITEFGILSGANRENSFTPQRYASFSFRTFNGYQFIPEFALGISIGADWYEDVVINPISIGVRGDLAKTRITPFYRFDIGRGSTELSKEEENLSNEGGLFWSLGLGIKIRLPQQTAFVFSVSYDEQNFKQTYSWIGWGSQIQERNFNRLALRMGFSF